MLKVGTPVSWRYRSAIGHGYVAGVASKGATSATTRYRVRQVDHHQGESGTVIHTGAALKRSTRSAVEAAAKRARARKR